SWSTNFLISQGQATRSTLTRSRVIHFIPFSRTSETGLHNPSCPISILVGAKPPILAHARLERAAAMQHGSVARSPTPPFAPALGGRPGILDTCACPPTSGRIGTCSEGLRRLQAEDEIT